MYDYPSGALHIGHWYVKTPDRRDRALPADARRQRVPARSASTRSGCRPRTPRSRTTSTRATGRWRTSRRCAASSARMGATWDWERRGRHLRPRVLPLEPVAVHPVPEGRPRLSRRCRRSTGAPTTARSRASRSRAPTATAGAAAPRSRSASSPQWYLRITNYADELLDFTGIDWPDPIRIMQTNWIGRSTGAEVVFETAPSAHHAGGEELRVFTTRPDTLFGATFMVLAPEHPLVATLTAPERRAEVEAYVAATAAKTEIDRLSTDREKTGVAHRRRRDQPGQRRADPDLRRRLRAGRLRHRRDHGRPGPRRARLRVREEVRAADRQRRHAQGRRPRRRARGGLRRAHRRRGHGQLGPVHRSPGGRGVARDRRLAGGARARARRRSPTACATG